MSSLERIADALERLEVTQATQGLIEWPLFVVPFFSALLGALTSAVLFHYLAKGRENEQRKQQKTQAEIDLFYSKVFIDHQLSLDETSRHILNGNIEPRHIARSILNPSNFSGSLSRSRYSGEKTGEYDEYDHLVLFIRRLEFISIAAQHDRLSWDDLSAAIGFHILRHKQLLVKINAEIRNAAMREPRPVPPLCDAIDWIYENL